ncbi:homoserine O-acetyltransferase [Desulfonatronum thiosulfatophilum]|uniref:Homoserine O-acetyltransferase n=1 Tax=Desulfonatronum thiosulfatophilum TaxID=617002 RepID=A0A1G6C107_9BACT|nr:homoserine O-acetyltransferase [Desulfonatronum thiosulfatophilum]SDB26540.1 homoserine O-acetyltransferase [Desulfonatronum thiosulfatophilum]
MSEIVKRPQTLPEVRPTDVGRLEPVRTQTVTFEGPGETLHLESGQTLHPITVAYETYGELNERRDNAVLVCHALSGDAHAAGYYGLERDEKPGWWDILIGPGKPLDTRKYFVICSNFLGGCKGTTGPSSINPATGKPYGMDFPFYTVKDMVQVQRRLLKHLGVPRLLVVIGGSLGGMQVLQWAISFPEMVRGAIPIASTARLSPQAIAFNEVARQAIMSDPEWNGGDYSLDDQPERGLGLARMIGHITYLSEQAMLRKFSRRYINDQGRSFCLTKDFQVESYLHHQGSSFVRRFDANTYLYITRAMDYFDLEAAYGRISTAFSGCRSSFLVVSFTSDWLFPPDQSRELVQALRRVGLDVSYCNIESDQGHDAFLLPGHRMGDVVSGFLERLARVDAS